ncbi:MAG: hypothetical protein LIP06_14150 [Tannerellaceae bacterium]|nr:hypothetical protein [Tannerellaceae bacterium]
MKHILLQKIFKYKKRETLSIPAGYEFDSFLGAWVSVHDKSLLLVNGTDFIGQGSKKCDIETGEDQKGQ